MSDEIIRSHLRQALSEVATKEKERVSAILDDAEKRIADGIEKMKPLMQLLKALKDEVAEIDGLEISLAEKGHMATVRAHTSANRDSLSISTNYDNSAFTIDESSFSSIYSSYREDRKECSSAEEVMARVIKLVGEHIGSQQAQSEKRGNA